MAQETKSNQIDFLFWIHTVIFLSIIVGANYLQPAPPLTPFGMKVAGVFLGVLYAWVFIDIIWPSLVGLLAIMLLGIMPPAQLFNKSFGDPIVVMMLFIFIFCAAISHYGLAKFISLWFISRKFVKGRPWVFTFTFLATVMLLGGLTSGTPALLIGWSLLYGVCDLCDYKKGEGYPTLMIIGVVLAAQYGMCIIPFKSVPLAIIGTYEKISGATIDYAAYMAIAIASGIALLTVFVYVGKLLLRPDMSKLRSLDISKLDKDSSLTLTFEQKLAMFFLISLLGLMLAPSVLPADFIVTRAIKSIGYTGICILIVMLMSFIRIGGKTFLPMKQMVDKGVSWEIIMLLAFIFPVSGLLSSPSSGVTEYFVHILDPLFGQGSPILFAMCLGGFAIILTQFVNNTALGTALMPVVYTYYSANNFSPDVCVIIVTIAVHVALLTPAASSTAAILHGNSEWCSKKSIFKLSSIIIVLAYAILAAIVLGLGRFIL